MHEAQQTILADTRDRDNDRCAIAGSLSRDLSLGDTKSIDALTNDCHRLLELVFRDRGTRRDRLGLQDDLSSSLQVQPQANAVICAWPERPDCQASNDGG